MGQPYNQPQMYQQPYNPFAYNQPLQQPPPQKQQQQQGGGLFDNFILNQISNSNNRNQYGW